MNLIHLRYFETLARTEHYSKAAEILSITQPSLSHAIASLEKELGGKLFEKEGRNVVLTKCGQAFLIDGEQALDMLRTKKIDLMVIDVMMPKLDGIRATFQARKTSSIPIIILSAKTEDADKILGLNVGADDYVTKPFNPLELVARVKSQLRRYTTLSSTPSGDAVYEAGGLVINDEFKKDEK